MLEERRVRDARRPILKGWGDGYDGVEKVTMVTAAITWECSDTHDDGGTTAAAAMRGLDETSAERRIGELEGGGLK